MQILEEAGIGPEMCNYCSGAPLHEKQATKSHFLSAKAAKDGAQYRAFATCRRRGTDFGGPITYDKKEISPGSKMHSEHSCSNSESEAPGKNLSPQTQAAESQHPKS